MSEIIFVVEQAPDGGCTARALGEAIFTQAESIDELHARCATPCIATSTKARRRR